MLLTDTVFIGEDDNCGGGSEAGLDASETYTLDFTGITPHPSQGFHVKLTINAEGSQGADVKHKVFWVTGCGHRRPTTTTDHPHDPDVPDPDRDHDDHRRDDPDPSTTAGADDHHDDARTVAEHDHHGPVSFADGVLRSPRDGAYCGAGRHGRRRGRW